MSPGKGKLILFSPRFNTKVAQTVKIKPLEESSLSLFLKAENTWVIGLIPDQILTQKLFLPIKKDSRAWSSPIPNPIF